MEQWVNKYKDIIEDDLFKATYDETIEFCEGLIAFLDGVLEEAQKEKLMY